MILELVRAQYFGTNCWIFAPDKNSECFIVDPGMAIPNLVPEIADVIDRHNLKPIATIVTHGHVDHTFSVHAFDERYGVATYIHPKDRPYLADPNGILTPGGPTIPILKEMGVTSFSEPADVRELVNGTNFDIAGFSIKAPMLFAFREREKVLDIMEMVSGLRMNMAYVRPGGVSQDIPEGGITKIRETVKLLRHNFKDNAKLLIGNSVWMKRTQGVGYLDLAGCITLGITGPILRATGLPWDLRKSEPYCGYENYEFDVITDDGCDTYGRFMIKMNELEQSLRIIEQCCDKLEKLEGAPVVIQDKKLGSPADLKVGPDGMGNSEEHIAHIMGQSMEALIHHFKLSTEGFRVPAGQVYSPVESPRGETGVHLISDGGSHPYRVHFREPSFNNLQSLAAMCEGSMIADVVAAVASIDPVMGGVDR